MAAIDPLSSGVLRRICAVLGDTGEGLTGREIAALLHEARIDDPGEMTKKDRLFEALNARQTKDGASNAVLACLKIALSPARFLAAPDAFDSWRQHINEALAFVGLTVMEDGTIKQLARAASTLSEARARANRSEDGATLVNRALRRSPGSLPMLALNRLETRTDQSEHDGYVNILRGLFGAFRNTTAHRPKVSWPISEQDALDMMTTASLLHRCLDVAVLVPVHLREAA